MAASIPPILWSIAAFIREGKVDAISILALSGIALSLIAFVSGGGVKFLQLRENLVTGGRADLFEILRGDIQFRRSMTVATVAWGFAFLGACALNCALVFMVSIRHFLLIGGPINYAVIGLMTAWTFWCVPRSMREAAARLAVAEHAGPAPSV
jgi:hypothetical protein